MGETSYDIKWLKNFESYKDYVTKHNRLPPKDAVWNGVNIGAWLLNQRSFNKRGDMKESRISLMDQFNNMWKSAAVSNRLSRANKSLQILEQNQSTRSTGKTPITDIKNIPAALLEKAIAKGITCCEDIIYAKHEDNHRIFLGDAARAELSAACTIYKAVSVASIRMITYMTHGYNSLGTTVNMHNLDDRLLSALSTIPDREAMVVKLYFGYIGGVNYTLEECGKYYNVTKSMARLIILQAMRRLKHRSRIKKILKG